MDRILKNAWNLLNIEAKMPDREDRIYKGPRARL